MWAASLAALRSENRNWRVRRTGCEAVLSLAKAVSLTIRYSGNIVSHLMRFSMFGTPSISATALNARRRRLGMTFGALARRSGVSEPTVKRILGGKSAAAASFGNVAAIAEALGCSLELGQIDVDEMREQEARKKAERIARLVQGSSALESQAVDEQTLRRLVERSYHELLAGPSRRLWSA